MNTDKWTIKELLIHMSDTERVFSYRALRFAQKDKTPLPGFEQNDYGKLIWETSRSIEHILEEFNTIRDSTNEQPRSRADGVSSLPML